MKTIRRLMLVSLLSVSFHATASAVPISFQLDNVTIAGASVASIQTYLPGFPIAGSGKSTSGSEPAR